MKFTFETRYHARSMASMARALRKTIRKKRSRRSHIFGWIAAILGLLLAAADFAVDFRTLLTSAAVLAIVAVLLLEDRINGYVASKRLLPGTEKAVSVFSENGFVSVTDAGKSEWKYDSILMIAETDDFFVFIFSPSHAQLYDKHHLEGGTEEEFRHFIQAVTGKQILPVT